MQLLATARQTQRCDRAAITGLRIPGLILMENAGRAFADALERRLPDLSRRSVTVVCGKGNNGGDGFVIARHLVNRGSRVTVAALARRREIAGDARVNLESLLRMQRLAGDRLIIREIRSRRALSALPGDDILIDAIFGTGFTGPARGIFRDGIEWINGRNAFVAAVDMPSGVDASTGVVTGQAVRAALTVTMGMRKIGQFVGAGRDCSGEVVVADIGIPPVLMSPIHGQVFRVEDSDVSVALPPLPRTVNKYSAGKVFVLAGSRAFTGAAALVAQSALRSGAGAVVLGAPASIHTVLARKLTEVILQPLPETEEGTLSPEGAEGIARRVAWADAVVIGPGLGRDRETDRFLRSLIVRIDRPIVLDADGLNALGSELGLLRRRRSATVVTPHSGELARLTGSDAATIDSDRVAAARSASRRSRSVVLLKGNPTVVASPGGSVLVNPTGNPGMATAGAGDVLGGVIGALIARGVEPLVAAWSGAFLHGRAGDLAAARLGRAGVLALDIESHLPAAFLSAGVR